MTDAARIISVDAKGHMSRSLRIASSMVAYCLVQSTPELCRYRPNKNPFSFNMQEYNMEDDDCDDIRYLELDKAESLEHDLSAMVAPRRSMLLGRGRSGSSWDLLLQLAWKQAWGWHGRNLQLNHYDVLPLCGAGYFT